MGRREMPGGGGGGANTRSAWLILTYALAADIVYRAGFARQPFGQIADLIFIWLGVQLFYVILEMSTLGSIVAAWRVSNIPSTVLAIVVAGVFLLLTTFWSAAVVLTGASALALMAVLAMILLARGRRV